MVPQSSAEWKLGAWQFAILRFAVTRDDADKFCVMELAGDLDSLCFRKAEARDFHFFRRTSGHVCAAILLPSEPSLHTLREYLKRVDDVRLRRATAAALKSVRFEAASSLSIGMCFRTKRRKPSRRAGYRCSAIASRIDSTPSLDEASS
jgi:hypothetical protein